MLVLQPVTSPPLLVRSMGPDMDTENMGTAEEFPFPARLLLQRPVGKNAGKQVNGILYSEIYTIVMTVWLNHGLGPNNAMSYRNTDQKEKVCPKEYSVFYTVYTSKQKETRDSLPLWYLYRQGFK